MMTAEEVRDKEIVEALGRISCVTQRTRRFRMRARVEALGAIGKEWEHHGRGPDKFDCVGLARWIWAKGGILGLPDFRDYSETHHEIIGDTTLEVTLSSLGLAVRSDLGLAQPPDFLVFRCNGNVGHLGVFVHSIPGNSGNDWFVHAIREKEVRANRISERYWKDRIIGRVSFPWSRAGKIWEQEL